MRKMIGFCGLDCEKCDAYLATIRNDDALRQKTAKLWAEMNNAPITPEMIHCTGCRADGVKTPYCDFMCRIRQCALSKGVETCGACAKFADCQPVREVLQSSPEAAENLRNR